MCATRGVWWRTRSAGRSAGPTRPLLDIPKPSCDTTGTPRLGTLVALSLWLIPTAWACTPSNTAEDGVDATDEDCDGSASIRREFVAAFESPFSVNADMVLNNASVGLSALTLSPTATAEAYARLRGDLSFESGQLTVVVRTAPGYPGGCSAKVQFGSTTLTQSITAIGVNTLTFPTVGAGSTLTYVGLTCPAGGSPAGFRWMTVQNGSYTWSPMVDTLVSFSGMALPTGGRQSVLRTSSAFGDTDGGLILTGSDVGGFAWSEAHDPEIEATEWVTANGGWHEWNDASEFPVWEIQADWRGDEASGASSYADPNEHDVYALTGEGTRQYGGLWYNASIDSFASSWEEIDDAMIAYKHADDCGDGKSISSGDLLVAHPDDAEWLIIGSGGPSTASTRGVHLYKNGSTAPPVEYWNGLPDGGSYSALPSALAAGRASDRDFVLVGYRTRTSGSAASSALYLCPADFDPDTTTPFSSALSCFAIASGGVFPTDVRDIEKAGDGRFFVADGGRAWDGDSCDLSGEATVYAVTVSATATAWVVNVWDTDTGNADPAWLVDASGSPASPYYEHNDDACFRDPTSSSGELVAPGQTEGEEAHDINTIVADPTGQYLFAFYGQGNESRRWGCTHVFRAEIPSSLGGRPTLDWEPFQEYVFGEMDWDTTGVHAAQRRDHVYARSGFLQAEPLLEGWAGSAVHDAVFVPGGSGVNLLTGGAFHWWLYPNGHSWDAEGVGWDSDGSVSDLDNAAWVLAWAGHDNGAVFGDMTALTAAVCPGCATNGVGNSTILGDSVLGGGAMDYKYATLYAEGGGTQPPAKRPCEFHMIQAAPVEIETWVNLSASPSSQAWMIAHSQNEDKPSNLVVDKELMRSIWFSEESIYDEIGEEWCWDGVKNGTRAGFVVDNFLSASTDWKLLCQDGGLIDPVQGFPACGPPVGPASGHDPFFLGAAGIGMPRALEVLGEDVAVVAAVAAKLQAGDSTATASTAGLWRVERGLWSLEYTKIAYDSSGMGACAESEFFEYAFSGETVVNRRVELDVHPSSETGLGDPARVFLSSRHPDCGIAEVTWIGGAESSATWKLLSLDSTDTNTTADCAMLAAGTQWYLNGVHSSRDGRWLFAYGGENSATTTYDSVCAIDLDSYDSTSGKFGSITPVVKPAQFKQELLTLTSHPHVEDVWYFGGMNATGCDTCTPAGLFALQRRRAWDTTTSAWIYRWGFYRLSDDDLQHRTITDIDLGPGEGGRFDPVTTFYISTAGGSWWDGRVSW